MDGERELSLLAEGWPEVELLVLFGSAAAGRLRPDSDVDLYIRMVGPRTADSAGARSFEHAASRILGREVDLVVETPSTSVILRREVASTGRPLFERNTGDFRQFVVDAVHAYMDLEPQLRIVGDAIRARAARDGSLALARLRDAGASRGR